MNVLVTSGGTIEKIDNVRSIINMSTGKLGSLIADEFLIQGFNVYYICNKQAVQPNADIIYIDSVDSLKNAITDLLKTTEIHIIIHAMAVSDYRLKNPFKGKLPSDADTITITLEKTPKIISIFQELAPHAVLVGFKLLDNVSQEKLIDTGYNLLKKNKCIYVLANDLKDIDDNKHIGHLIDKDKNYTSYYTKQEIAKAIAAKTINRRGELRSPEYEEK